MILRPVPPFRLDLTVWALRRRARNAIDRWDGTTYRRVVTLGRRPTELAVRQEGHSTMARVIVTVTRAVGSVTSSGRTDAMLSVATVSTTTCCAQFG